MSNGTNFNTFPVNIKQFSVDSSSNVNIPAGSYYKIDNVPLVSATATNITYAALATLRTNSTLAIGQWYNVTNRNVVLFATDINGIALSGFYKSYNADYQATGVYTGVLAATGIAPVGTNQGVWNTGVTHTIGSLVIWGGANWINATGAIGTATSDTALSAAWTKLAASLIEGYIFEVDSIDYDFSNDVVVKRSDKRGNLVSSNNPVSFSDFQWGNDSVHNNTVTDESILHCLNNLSTISSNNLSGQSIIYGMNSAALISTNNLTTGGQIIATTQVAGAQINNNEVSSGSTILATSNAGVIVYNSLNSSSLTCTNQGSTGETSYNSLNNQSAIDVTTNLGVVSTNDLDSESLISAFTQTATGVVQLNSLSNDSQIDVATNAGSVVHNVVSKGGSINASAQVAGGSIDNNDLMGGVINGATNQGLIHLNSVFNGSAIVANTNGAAGIIQDNVVIGASTLTATTNTGIIQQCFFSRGRSISYAGNSAVIQDIEFTGSGVIGGTQTLTGAGAVSLLTENTLLVTTGANALTLAAGLDNQNKFIKMKTDGGDGTLTPNALQGGTTITFNDAGDFVLLKYVDSKWNIIVNSGTTIA